MGVDALVADYVHMDGIPTEGLKPRLVFARPLPHWVHMDGIPTEGLKHVAIWVPEDGERGPHGRNPD